MDEKSRCGLPSIVSASMIIEMLAVANVNPNCQQTRWDVLTETFKVPSWKIVMGMTNCILRVDSSFNWCRFWTLRAIECSIPSPAAYLAWTIYPHVCIISNKDGTNSRQFSEPTVLLVEVNIDL